ncbi:MAG TPA: tripartite tricarboxylate transporter substrate-binding protein [Candidatus Eisenbacteria bacterium]|nr:tripartite tricarboxylate transporter substrate-binding protein [Candidatus Eisenbacteria bacterium]
MGRTLLLLTVCAALFPRPAAGAGADQDFYKGKTIRVIVGFAAGGGFDAYARAIARHMPKYIPGQPAMIVDNMAGAGSRLAANYLYKASAPDGLTIGNFIGSLLLQQILGDQGIEFDGRKFEWLGAPVMDDTACALTKASGITALDQWFASKRPIKLGGEAPGANDSDVPRILRAALNLPIQLIEGYKGTSFIRIAAEAGEVDGGCWTWASIRSTWKKGIESGQVNVVLQVNAKKAPDIPHVPNAIDYAKTAEAKELIEAGIHAPSAILRAYALPPGTPPGRLAILREAFMLTMKDKDFAAELAKANLDLNPLSGSQVESIARKLYQVDAAMVGKLREILLPKK